MRITVNGVAAEVPSALTVAELVAQRVPEDARRVAVAVNAWNDGLRAAGVLGVVKHWPGHGQATDTHVGGSLVPAWSMLRRRDLIPFNAAFAHRAPAVMVGHLRVPGLTEGALPATESRAGITAGQELPDHAPGHPAPG